MRVDEKLLEALREQSGLRLDKHGQFWHQGTRVEHERTQLVLHQGVHRAPDGRWATRIGKEWGYLDVEDAALFVERIDGLQAKLVSGRVAPLDPDSFAIGLDDALYVRIGGERARLTRAAQLSLASALHEEGGSFTLELQGRRHAVSADVGPEPISARSAQRP